MWKFNINLRKFHKNVWKFDRSPEVEVQKFNKNIQKFQFAEVPHSQEINL